MRLHPIIVDKREKDPDAETQVRGIVARGGMAGVGFLEVGDLQWVCEPDRPGEEWETWLGERKSVKDLLASVPPASDRLTRFFEMTGGFEPPTNLRRFLLLEGDQFRFVSWGREWTPEALDNLLVSLQEKGIMVVRSRGPAETPARIVSLWKRSGSMERGMSILRPSKTVASDAYLYPEDREAVAFVMGLPGVGEDRAVAILREFGSVAAVMESAIHETKGLAKAKGVGTGIAKKVSEFLERKVMV